MLGCGTRWWHQAGLRALQACTVAVVLPLLTEARRERHRLADAVLLERDAAAASRLDVPRERREGAAAEDGVARRQLLLRSRHHLRLLVERSTRLGCSRQCVVALDGPVVGPPAIPRRKRLAVAHERAQALGDRRLHAVLRVALHGARCRHRTQQHTRLHALLLGVPRRDHRISATEAVDDRRVDPGCLELSACERLEYWLPHLWARGYTSCQGTAASR
eukprot:2864774-Prymnesium_polylepis.1